MTKEFKQISNVFPAGEYYIGDFCYLLNDEDYANIVYSRTMMNLINIKFTFLFGNTAYHYRDGQYSDNQGYNHYSADSGTIGIINLPTEKLQQTAKELMKDNNAIIIKFDAPF